MLNRKKQKTTRMLLKIQTAFRKSVGDVSGYGIINIVPGDIFVFHKSDTSICYDEKKRRSECLMDKLKILVVDDESRMRKLVKDFLTRSGYTVVEAADGMEAMDISMSRMILL